MTTIPQTKEQIDNWFNTNNHEHLSFDTETSGVEWDKANIESICFFNGKETLLILNKHLIPYIKHHLYNIKTLIAHNITFDLKVLWRTHLFEDWFNTKLDSIKLYDSMVAHHLLDENIKSIALKDLAQQVLKKEKVMEWEEASKFSKNSKEWINYCSNDVLWTWELMEYQKPLLEKDGLNNLFYDIEMPFQLSLMDMEINGILVDQTKVQTISKSLKIELVTLTKHLLNELKLPYQVQNTLSGESTIQSPVNFNSSQQLAKILFEQLRLPIIETTPSGAPSVGAVTIEKLKDRSKFVGLLSKYKAVQKILSGFIEPLPTHICEDGRVRPHLFDVGTVTGRLSSSSPNIQQLPRPNKDFEINVRDCFIADVGYKIFTSDFSGQEIRVMAELSEDPTLVDALINGKDLHLTIANQFYNLKIPKYALYETNPEYKMYKEKFKNERQTAKTITFGLSYGKGAYGFAKDFNITEDEAQILIDKYFNGMPLLRKAINDSQAILNRNGYVTTLVGRRRRFKLTQMGSWEGYIRHDLRQCFNFLIQGLSADMIRIAINNVRRESRKKPELGIQLLATVHDELIVQGKEGFIKEITQLLRECFEFSMKLCVPLPCEIGFGDSYGKAK